jgi:hypothetical protein
MRAPSDAIARLEHEHRLAVPVQLDRGSQAREPGTDDRDVDLRASPWARLRESTGRTGQHSPRPGGGRRSDEPASSEPGFLRQGRKILPTAGT